jgi:hypothetical protein
MEIVKKTIGSAVILIAVLGASLSEASAAEKAAESTRDVRTIELRFKRLLDLANKHDINGIHAMFWQSPSALLVAKSAVPSEGEWAGFWGNDAIDQKLHDIADSGPVVLKPDLSRLKVVTLSSNIAESYDPLEITVSYAGQDGTPKPFLMIMTWKKISGDWKVASEIILPVPAKAPPA